MQSIGVDSANVGQIGEALQTIDLITGDETRDVNLRISASFVRRECRHIAKFAEVFVQLVELPRVFFEVERASVFAFASSKLYIMLMPSIGFCGTPLTRYDSVMPAASRIVGATSIT